MCLENAANGELKEYDQSIVACIRTEMSRKVFHSRVNEFINGRKELDLERRGKTDADQSL